MQTNKLDAMEARFRSLEDQLSDPSVIFNQNKWRTLSKEHSDLGEIVTLYRSDLWESEGNEFVYLIRFSFSQLL